MADDSVKIGKLEVEVRNLRDKTDSTESWIVKVEGIADEAREIARSTQTKVEHMEATITDKLDTIKAHLEAADKRRWQVLKILITAIIGLTAAGIAAYLGFK